MKAVVVGASYGGIEAIRNLLVKLPENFELPIIIVLHIGNNKINNYLLQLNHQTNRKVKEAEEKEPINRTRFHVQSFNRSQNKFFTPLHRCAFRNCRMDI